ncbi:hypothetical protein [Rathayibacter sp. AY1A3]|uniref:hypothetical protein n=1 Tax=Rathayibacter sp. AY1A3 TaxID=2080521 RepID=UPI0015E2E161|nr:hypothetical protein [Rathayibacter sp. AY1A3]
MSSLLPNVEDLLAALPDNATASDARQLAEAALSADSQAELDAALSRVVQGWLA